MKHRIIIPLLISVFILSMTGCGTMSNQDGLAIASDVDYGKDDYQKINSANNELGFQLLSKVVPDDEGNIFISPTSLLMALSMVYNGADGETKDEIAKALQTEGIDVEDLNKANASFMSMLHNRSKQVELNVANSIWLNEHFHFQKHFKTNTQDYFNAKIQEVDITDSKTPNKINDWVQQSTNSKIEDIVDSRLDPNIVSILINAIYFKGDWTYEFDQKLTEDRPFHLKDGSTKDVPLMTVKEKLAYMENDDIQAVTLPYGEKQEMSMNVILPKESTSLEKIIPLLTNENWQAWKTEMKPQEGTVMLPKFQLEYETILNESLEKLGMKTAFQENTANFSKMIQEDESIWISQIKQKTFIDVNEKGTEAAAATSVEMKITSALIDGPFIMEINRPFIIMITDHRTDAILFLGAIRNPMEGK
ncbi:serpin family protein [Lederbergia sp. NSJ-179]|uniref:serpin family protein n=1 Tax=Lederbergia sp. NSJ-179 TaxID=2931402 RepID=UPI001FD1274E|nr:serpin family protein [Lederbergia sp. NSJ-179]MCJ7842457.1 serpin family protein [Lederbergia sp. NSJ-179]